MSSNCVWLQIIFCSCVNETTFFSFFRSFCVQMADRFAGLSESEFACLLNQKNSENTKKATKVAHNVFWEYLKEKKLTKESLVSWKKKSWRLLKQYRYIESVNVVILTLPKFHLIDKRIQFAVQEEQLYAECGARLKNFHSSSLLWICLSLFETDLNKAKYSIYEKLSTVFSVAGFCFEEKYSHQV